MPETATTALQAPHVLEYPYTRSVGPVVGRFLAALRDRRIEGVRTRSGAVLVPPTEYDPATGQALGEFVDVGSSGVVTTWTWVVRPRPGAPLDRPFAWALVCLDGADTAMLHAVDAGDEARMRTGMRVRARWRSERVGHIRDIECFEPEPPDARGAERLGERSNGSPVTTLTSPVRLEYTYTPGRAASRFLRAIAEGRIIGQRCPGCAKVYVPPRGSCPRCGVATVEEVELADTGTVTTFCVVNLPFAGQAVSPPYVCASVLLDGADTPIFHLVQEVPVEAVRMGMRVRAVWAPAEARPPTLESIRYFRPTGEPDVPIGPLEEPA